LTVSTALYGLLQPGFFGPASSPLDRLEWLAPPAALVVIGWAWLLPIARGASTG